jgi:hypothetical protein
VFVPLCVVFLPVFLFDRIENSTTKIPVVVHYDLNRRPEPSRSALFQRPPPSLS